MKRTFDDAVNPSVAADLQAKTLEQKILMASKGADAGDSVIGGFRAKGASVTGQGMRPDSKKKASENYLELIQQQLINDLNAMTADLEKLGKELDGIDTRMAERQATIDFITQELHDKDDLLDADGNYNPHVQALLKAHGKEDLTADEAYLFITGTLTQQLYDEQEADQTKRDDVAEDFDQKQREIQDKIEQGRDMGIDMMEQEKQVATMQQRRDTSQERASASVTVTDDAFDTAAQDSTDEFDVFLSDTLSL